MAFIQKPKQVDCDDKRFEKVHVHHLMYLMDSILDIMAKFVST